MQPILRLHSAETNNNSCFDEQLMRGCADMSAEFTTKAYGECSWQAARHAGATSLPRNGTTLVDVSPKRIPKAARSARDLAGAAPCPGSRGGGALGVTSIVRQGCRLPPGVAHALCSSLELVHPLSNLIDRCADRLPTRARGVALRCLGLDGNLSANRTKCPIRSPGVLEVQMRRAVPRGP